MLGHFLIGHLKRLLQPCIPADQRVITIGMPKVVQVVDDFGRIVHKVEWETDYSPSADARVSDFSLDNLLAAGVNLNEMPKLEISRLSSADNLTFGIETIDYNGHVAEPQQYKSDPQQPSASNNVNVEPSKSE